MDGGRVCYVYHYIESDPEKDVHVWTKRDLPATAAGYNTQTADYIWDQMGDMTWAEAEFTWSSKIITSLAPLNVFGDENGRLWVLGGSNSFNGQPINAYAIFGPVGWSHPEIDIEDRTKELTLVEPWAGTGNPGEHLAISVGTSVRGGGPFAYGEQVLFSLDGSGYPWVNFQTKGRIFSLKFSTPSGEVGNRWRLYGYLVELGVEGRA